MENNIIHVILFRHQIIGDYEWSSVPVPVPQFSQRFDLVTLVMTKRILIGWVDTDPLLYLKISFRASGSVKKKDQTSEFPQYLWF